jgi:hypothetical protein
MMVKPNDSVQWELSYVRRRRTSDGKAKLRLQDKQPKTLKPEIFNPTCLTAAKPATPRLCAFTVKKI